MTKYQSAGPRGTPARTSICIHNLQLQTILGVYEKERLRKREVVVNMRYDVAASCSGTSDTLDSAVDYAGIRDKLISVATDSRARLLEHLAECMLQVIVEDARILSVTITVEKPGALRGADSVSVTKEWARLSSDAVVTSQGDEATTVALLEIVR